MGDTLPEAIEAFAVASRALHRAVAEKCKAALCESSPPAAADSTRSLVDHVSSGLAPYQVQAIGRITDRAIRSTVPGIPPKRRRGLPPLPQVYPPGIAAASLGMTVPDLVKLVREGRFEYTEIRPGGSPGSRGRNRWGLTSDQVRFIRNGMARVPAAPKEKAQRDPTTTTAGKSRLRMWTGRSQPKTEPNSAAHQGECKLRIGTGRIVMPKMI